MTKIRTTKQGWRFFGGFDLPSGITYWISIPQPTRSKARAVAQREANRLKQVLKETK